MDKFDLTCLLPRTFSNQTNIPNNENEFQRKKKKPYLQFVYIVCVVL